MELKNFTISDVHKGLINKDFSCIELTNVYLDFIDKKDKEIDAYLELTPDLALSQAERVDKKIQNKEEIEMLSGVPCAIKDNILIQGKRASAGSKILQEYIASYDAGVIKKLKEKDVVFLGKTNLDEFAMGSSGENSAFKITKNPHDLSRVPGGSSSGSSAAVASNQCVFALGSDTGGSIRQPAGFCGVVGLKPTYGAVSRSGLIAMASSLDQIGPIAKSVEDAALIFESILGFDKLDSTSDSNYEYFFEKPRDFDYVKDLRIGLPKEYFIEGVDEDVKKSVLDAVKIFEKAGAKIIDISLPHTEYALACYYLIMPTEVASNLARFDGIRYGKRHPDKPRDFWEIYFKTKGEDFGEETRRRIILGTFVSSAGYYDAYYSRAQKVRNLIKQDFIRAFENVDIIITPTSPTPAFKIGEKTQDPVQMYLSDVFTASANLTGMPAISLFCGFSSRDGKRLPIGAQIIGKHFDEKTIINSAYFLSLTQKR